MSNQVYTPSMDTPNSTEATDPSLWPATSKSSSSHCVVLKLTFKKKPKRRNWRLPNSLYRVQKDACRLGRKMGHAAETVQVHSKKRVQCPACTRTLHNRCQVVQHCVSHTGEKPYSCIVPGCDMWMRCRSTVVYHAHMHIISEDIKLIDDVGAISIFKKREEHIWNEASLDELEQPEQDAVLDPGPS